MNLGRIGFSSTARNCCSAPGSGRGRWRMRRMWCRKPSCVSGGTSAVSRASRWHCSSPRSAARPLIARDARVGVPRAKSGRWPKRRRRLLKPFDGDERRIAIEEALQRIPHEQREVLVLKIWGELTFGQIATELELSPNTAASRYRYALAALRQELTAADCHG